MLSVRILTISPSQVCKLRRYFGRIILPTCRLAALDERAQRPCGHATGYMTPSSTCRMRRQMAKRRRRRKNFSSTMSLGSMQIDRFPPRTSRKSSPIAASSRIVWSRPMGCGSRTKTISRATAPKLVPTSKFSSRCISPFVPTLLPMFGQLPSGTCRVHPFGLTPVTLVLRPMAG